MFSSFARNLTTEDRHAYGITRGIHAFLRGYAVSGPGRFRRRRPPARTTGRLARLGPYGQSDRRARTFESSHRDSEDLCLLIKNRIGFLIRHGAFVGPWSIPISFDLVASRLAAYIFLNGSPTYGD